LVNSASGLSEIATAWTEKLPQDKLVKLVTRSPIAASAHIQSRQRAADYTRGCVIPLFLAIERVVALVDGMSEC
jgi:hypothetical protein